MALPSEYTTLYRVIDIINFALNSSAYTIPLHKLQKVSITNLGLTKYYVNKQ